MNQPTVQVPVGLKAIIFLRIFCAFVIFVIVGLAALLLSDTTGITGTLVLAFGLPIIFALLYMVNAHRLSYFKESERRLALVYDILFLPFFVWKAATDNANLWAAVIIIGASLLYLNRPAVAGKFEK